MADGEVRCCGSSMFLKHRYGVGYNLTLVKESNCDARTIQNKVTSIVPSSRLLSNVGSELSFQLPMSSSSKVRARLMSFGCGFSRITKFAELFRWFDANMDRVGMSTYGVSVTTLEEVFLKASGSFHQPSILISLFTGGRRRCR